MNNKYPDGYYKNKKTGSEAKMTKNNTYNKETVEEVKNYPIRAIEERGITEETCRRLGIRTGLSTEDGVTPVAHYFPYSLDGKLVGYKKRDLTKPKMQEGHFSIIGFQSIKCDMFNMANSNKTGGSKVWVTEGEYDCALVWQTLKAKFGKVKPSVVSISNGTAAAVLNIGQKHNMKFLSKFKEVVLAFDNDSATPSEKVSGIKKGKEATADVYGLLPEVKVVSLPDDKDPCDTFLEQGEEQFYWTINEASTVYTRGFCKVR